MKLSRKLLFLPGALGVLALLGGCSQEIPPANVGIKFNANSGISEHLEKPQVVWLGWGDQLITFPTSIHNATFVKNVQEGDKQKDDSIRCSTVEGAILPVDVTVAYHVQAENVLTAFTSFGSEDIGFIQNEFLRWVTIDGMNCVSGKHSIFDLLSTDRPKFGPEVKAIIAPIMANWGITVDDVYIGEVYPPDDVRAKVQERIAAQNELELAKVRLQKATIDAKTILTNAERDAQTNQLLAQQGKTVVELKRLEIRNKAIEKWDGRPPLVGGNTIPFTDINLK